MKKVFFISPVARATGELRAELEAYVKNLEENNHEVHLPHRDTQQKDSTGGYNVCKTNARAIMNCDEIHIWYEETSGGSKFDIGVTFTLVVMMGYNKKIVIVNDDKVTCENEKSFLKVLRYHIENVQNAK